MPNESMGELLKFANLQMAAEAFLLRAEDGGVLPVQAEIARRLEDGNGHASKFMPSQAEEFLREYEVVSQYRNDPHRSSGTGFSGTLFRHRDSGQLTLSFRSTEFIDDAVRDSKATNDLELRQLGWALGQISEMESWYELLREDVNLLKDKSFNVTGYSLGGHLATAFNILRRQETEAGGAASPVLATFTFNGAGVGDLRPGHTLTEVLDNFNRFRSIEFEDDPIWTSLTEQERNHLIAEATSRANVVIAEQARIEALAGVPYALGATRPPFGEQATVQYQIAAILAARDTVPVASFPFANGVNDFPSTPKFAEEFNRQRFDNMTEVVGSDGGNLGPSFVSNSGIHYGQRIPVYIEDQPLTRGSYDLALHRGDLIQNPTANDFADTHSLVLLVDSLSLLAAMEELDPTIDAESIDRILQASASSRAVTTSGTDGQAEGDTMERVLDAFREVVLGPEGAPTLTSSVLLLGNTWYDQLYRDPYHLNSAELMDEIREVTQLGAEFEIEDLTDKPAAELETHALADSQEGEAYRYALQHLNSFALHGWDYQLHRANGGLDLFSSASGTGMTERYLQSRAEMLAVVLDANLRNRTYVLQSGGESTFFEDREEIVGGEVAEFGTASVTPETEFGAQLPILDAAPNDERGELILNRLRIEVQNNRIQRVSFGSDGADEFIGSAKNDRLFGGAGGDVLEGKGGADYLEGGSGTDLLIGGDGADTLFGLDASGGDRLRGGGGYDTFYADWGDTISDTPESPRGGIIYVGADNLQLGEAFRFSKDSFFTGSNGVKYWESSDGAIAAYLPGGEKLIIEAPGGAVSGRSSVGNVQVTGRPDLGIRLVTVADERPALRLGKEAIPGLLELAVTWRPFADPLALDLDGDGIETLGGAPGRAVLFDHAGDGVRNGTGWLNGDDGWVAIDLDDDGMISSGRELFGVDTRLPDGTNAANGFAAIAPLDSSGNGRIDAADEQFFKLLVWRDENLNGISEGFELQSLAAAGITSISLAAQPANQVLAGENVLRFRGAFQRTDGTTGAAAALDLVRKNFYREYSEAPLAADSTDGIPNVRGSGQVRDIQEASAESDAVKLALAGAAAAQSALEQRARVDTLLDAWANSSSMETGRQAALNRQRAPLLYYGFQDLQVTAPGPAYLNATGGNVPLSSLAPDWFLASQSAEYRERVRKIEVLERFSGQTFADTARAGVNLQYSAQNGAIRLDAMPVSVGHQNWLYLEQAYAALQEQTYLAVALETRLSGYVDAFVRGQDAGNYAEVEALFQARRADGFAQALTDLADLTRAVGYELVDRGWIGLPVLLQQWVREAHEEPALASVLTDLNIRFRSSHLIQGTGVSDLLFGDDWIPVGPPPGAWITEGSFGDDFLFGDEYRPTDISGGPGHDVFLGGPEESRFSSGTGRDIFLFGRGSGVDSLKPEGNLQLTALDRDVLQFLPDVAPEDLLVRRIYDPFNGSNTLEFRIAGTGDVFTDKLFFHTLEGGPRAIEEVRFADGTRWDLAEIRRQAVTGSDGNDNRTNGRAAVFGSAASEVLDGRGGDDLLMADAGNDVLLGGAGMDTLEGFSGADVLDGGAGTDRLYGGFGVDTYMLQRGGGRDEIFRTSFITNQGADSLELDTVRAGAGISPNEVLVQWTPTGTRVFLRDGSAELWDSGSPHNTLYLGVGATLPSFARIEFEDGTAWDNAQIKARALQGQTEGADELWGYDNSSDQLRGLGGADVIRGQGGNDDIAGGDGNDILEGALGDDTLDGGAGDDQLYGGAGADTFWLRPGGGQDHLHDGSLQSGSEGGQDVLRIAAGISPGDLTLVRRDEVNRIALADGTSVMDRDTVENIIFADGTTWDTAELRRRIVFHATEGNDVIVGFEGNSNALRGLGGNDLLVGGDEADLLSGGAGDDVLDGGGGADVYEFGRGDGVDEIWDFGDETVVNVLHLRDVARGELIRPSALVLQIGGTNDRIDLRGQNPIGQVRYSDGSLDTLAALPTTYTPPPPDDGGGTENPFGFALDLFGVGSATDGDDLIYGTDGRETLSGGAGFDFLVGHGGADTYTFARGDGVEVILDSNDEDGRNIIQFGPDIRPQDLIASAQDGFLLWQIAGTEEGVVVWGDAPELRFASDEGETSEDPDTGASEAPPAPGPEVIAEAQEEIPLDAALPQATLPASTPPSEAARRTVDSPSDIASPSSVATSPNPSVGISSDPVYRDIEKRLDVLLQVGRTNLSERYAEAVREFEERRRLREEPTQAPQPTDEEVGAWNRAMHAWHDKHPSFDENDIGGGSGGWALGWENPVAGENSIGGAAGSGSVPGLANPHALPRLSGVGEVAVLRDGLRTL